MSNIWLNSIYQGDILDTLDWLYQESGAFVDLVFTDPPYNLEKTYNLYNDNLHDKAYVDWCNEWLYQYIRLLKPNGSLFVLNLPKWATHHAVFLNQHMYFQNWIVWDALASPRGKIMPAHYTLLHYTMHPTDFTLNPESDIEPNNRCLRTKCIKSRNPDLPKESLSTIWHDIHRIKHAKDRDEHPCQLPEKLLERVIRIASNPGDVVLDGFMGTGTTAVVAKRMGRKFVGVEKDDFYIDIARKRLDSPVKEEWYQLNLF